jgi:hypothetical protein
MSDLEQRIRERAYKIWLDEGCPEGRANVHWEMARELVAIEDNTPLALRPAPHEGADGPAGEPIEGASAAVTGELPTMDDQGERQYPPSRSRSDAWFGFGRRGQE